jgi:hypothetical protein
VRSLLWHLRITVLHRTCVALNARCSKMCATPLSGSFSTREPTCKCNNSNSPSTVTCGVTVAGKHSVECAFCHPPPCQGPPSLKSQPTTQQHHLQVTNACAAALLHLCAPNKLTNCLKWPCMTSHTMTRPTGYWSYCCCMTLVPLLRNADTQPSAVLSPA